MSAELSSKGRLTIASTGARRASFAWFRRLHHARRHWVQFYVAHTERVGYATGYGLIEITDQDHAIQDREHDPAEMEGPPFSTPGQTAETLFGQAYRIELLSTKEILDENPGLKKRGLGRLTEKAYWLSALG